MKEISEETQESSIGGMKILGARTYFSFSSLYIIPLEMESPCTRKL